MHGGATRFRSPVDVGVYLKSLYHQKTDIRQRSEPLGVRHRSPVSIDGAVLPNDALLVPAPRPKRRLF
jgi:hypothetical protein